jgi:DNA modification methylase
MTKTKIKKEYIEMMLTDLKPHPKNPKDHDIEAIKRSIKHNEALAPIEIDENNMILAGHGRLQALTELGYTSHECVRYTGLTDKQKERYVLESNKTTMNKGFLEDKLKLFDVDTLESAGFVGGEIDHIFRDKEDNEDEFNASKFYDSIKTPHTKHGDIYKLGEHRLMCGNATDTKDMDALMDGHKADMVFVDPPYNVNYKGRKGQGILGDNMSEEEFIDFTLNFIQRLSEQMKTGAPYYICSGYSSYPIFLYALQATGLQFSTPIIWVKNQATMGWQDYRHKHEMLLKAKNVRKRKQAEPVMYGWNGGKHYWIGVRDEVDVWEYSRRAGNTMVHPTQKPIPMINRALKNSSKRGGIILDSFGGSGSTLISAEKTARTCYMMELDPKFVDTIKERWEALTGQKTKKIE